MYGGQIRSQGKGEGIEGPARGGPGPAKFSTRGPEQTRTSKVDAAWGNQNVQDRRSV